MSKGKYLQAAGHSLFLCEFRWFIESVPSKLDKHVIDKALQRIDDLISCVSPFVFFFSRLTKRNKLIREKKKL